MLNPKNPIILSVIILMIVVLIKINNDPNVYLENTNNIDSAQDYTGRSLNIAIIDELRRARFSPFYRKLTPKETADINGYSHLENQCLPQ